MQAAFSHHKRGGPLKITALQQFLLPRRLSLQEVNSSHCTVTTCLRKEVNMQDLEVYRKFVTLNNGKEILIRLLNGQDRAGLLKFFQQAHLEDIQFCKQDVKSPKVIDAWMNPGNCHKPLTLLGFDLPTNRVVASLNLSKGQQSDRNVGDIQQILVARPFQGVGLGSLILDGMIELAIKDNLHWLKVEVVTERKEIIKAFQSKGFHVQTIMDDYFMDSKGKTFDVALMLRSLINNNYDDF
jgi:ribosomal protein S18 acetylase RimI-like enzyme